MQYIVEYATHKFTFKKRYEALTLAELMASHNERFSPWTVAVKVIADEEDREDERKIDRRLP